jgi:proteasome lid subunit RPN8/RPN11
VTLVIGPDARDAMRSHGEATYPEECCGFLLGREDGPERRRLVRLVRLANERVDSRNRRYVISPETYLEVERDAEREGLDLVGIYHSHPDAAARPSEFDRAHALPGLSYVIVAVGQGAAAEVASWRLREDRTRFDEEPIEIPDPEREEIS